MGRNDLINTTRAILAKAGFDVSSALSLRGICFDVVARLDDRVLIIKVLSNIDAFSKDNAEELKTLAEALGATPIVIGERSSSGSLETGIVYSRFNISIISNDTLADLLLEDAPPFIFAAPGGLYVRLDSEMLRAAREERGISLGTLAETAGVSRRTIQMYESGMGAMIDAALRIEEYLGLPIVEPIDPFEFKSKERSCEERSETERIDTFAVNQLCNLGFSVRPVVRAVVASDIARIMNRFSVLIVERKHDRDNIDSTAVVSNDELKKIEAPEDLTELVASRGTKK